MSVKWNSVKVKEGNREMQVLIPDLGDRSETHDITEAAVEKTKDELRHNQRQESKVNPADRRTAIREALERRERRREGTGNRKYY